MKDRLEKWVMCHKLAALVVPYVVSVVTLTLLIQIFGVPFVSGR